MKKQIKLIFDVSTERGVVGIFIDEKLSFYEELPFGTLSSKYLLPTIEKGFHTLAIHPASLTYVAVGVGPGSYTGIRLGAVVAKTLAFACEIPLIGICTSEGFVPDLEGCFASLIDAKISGAYFQKGLKVNGTCKSLCKPKVISLADLKEELGDVRFIVTPNIQPLKSKIEALYPECSWEWIEMAPNMERFYEIAEKKFKNREFDPSGELELNYLRKTQAEIERGF